MAERSGAAHWDEPDALIIGAGASGAAVAWFLAREGWRVVCLEQGGWVDLKSTPPWQQDWELRRLGDFSANPNVRRLREDYPVNDTESAFSPLMFNAVGGSTIHWSAHFPRYHPSDFKVRSLDGVGDDWPLSYEELEPFFDLNDQMIGVAGLSGDPSVPIRSPRQTRPIPLGPMGERIAAGFDKLGWHWWPSDSAIITEPYGGEHRQPCNNCGPCDLCCPTGAMSSANVTYWPLAMTLGVDLRTRCRVREITVDPQGRATGALYYDESGALQHQRAPVVILGANGVGTPRLLLNSRSAAFPNGLANRNGLVGKNLMFHPFASATGYFEEDFQSYRGPIGCSLLSQEFYETDAGRDFVRGFTIQIGRQSGPLNTALGGFTQHRIPWGQGHHEEFDARFGRGANVSIIGEDLPEEVNNVTLDPDLTDSDGIPAPRVRYRLSDNSLRMMEFATARAREVLEAAGAARILMRNPLRNSGWHLLGTCRMGDTPFSGVVDRWGRAHDVPNLFIVDGSVFVTSAAVNPTTTLQALALRTADHLVRSGRGGTAT
ncbi:MAG: GMC family oxidoreductase [Chloroflexota bacterium]